MARKRQTERAKPELTAHGSYPAGAALAATARLLFLLFPSVAARALRALASQAAGRFRWPCSGLSAPS